MKPRNIQSDRVGRPLGDDLGSVTDILRGSLIIMVDPHQRVGPSSGLSWQEAGLAGVPWFGPLVHALGTVLTVRGAQLRCQPASQRHRVCPCRVGGRRPWFIAICLQVCKGVLMFLPGAGGSIGWRVQMHHASPAAFERCHRLRSSVWLPPVSATGIAAALKCHVAMHISKLDSRPHTPPRRLIKRRSMRSLTLLLALGLATLLLTQRAVALGIDYVTFLDNGEVAGHQRVRQVDARRLRVDYRFTENGRGPVLAEEFRFGPGGALLEFHVRGTSEMGGVVDEHFIRTGGLAQWQSASERGRARVRPDAVYVPMDGSLQINSVLIGRLARSSTGVLDLLPSGKVSSKVLGDIAVRRGEETRRVRLLMLTGLGLQPDFMWATTGRSPRLFASITPGYASTVESGWEESLSALLAYQKAALDKFMQARANRLRHPLVGQLVIRNARVFDSARATLGPLEDVYVRDNRVVAIRPAGGQGDEAQSVIDAGGRVLLPGLFDMHAHINRWSAAYNLAAGVTTVRDLGNSNRDLLALTREVEEGRLLGPSVIRAGLIDGRGPFATSDGVQIETLEEARSAVDWYADNGYPHLKIYGSFPHHWVAEVVAYAHARCMTVGGHVPAFMTATQAVEAGYDELNHINQLMLNFYTRLESDSRTLDRFYLPAEHAGSLDFDAPPVREFIRLLADRQTVVDPTLAGFDFLKQVQGELAEPFATIEPHMPPIIARSFRTATMAIPDEETARRYRKSYARMVEFVGLLYREGVPLVAGTDTFAGFGLHSELALYVKAGLTPAEALQVATRNGARYTRTLDDRGSVEVGKRADLVLIDGDPTRDIESIRRVALVITQGSLIYPCQIHQEIGVRPFVDVPPQMRTLSPGGDQPDTVAPPCRRLDVGSSVADRKGVRKPRAPAVAAFRANMPGLSSDSRGVN